jgi:hypothetical protein
MLKLIDRNKCMWSTQWDHVVCNWSAWNTYYSLASDYTCGRSIGSVLSYSRVLFLIGVMVVYCSSFLSYRRDHHRIAEILLRRLLQKPCHHCWWRVARLKPLHLIFDFRTRNCLGLLQVFTMNETRGWSDVVRWSCTMVPSVRTLLFQSDLKWMTQWLQQN